ncbi:unnamed protein product [Diatraea saccharalis]|uniref:Mutant cadherin n=1 Tax=Diatraea saccharalis TaxID=40085 RepID=A0A9N9REZ3_9NEOP|nr:unnamed protein product [Diatraea saccharalis]
MSSTKCDSCNIVISEVLAFIQNKLEVMDQISLVQLCLGAFSAEDIAEAKILLYDCIKSGKKKSQRKRDGKTQKDLEDIICVFRELEPKDFPIFVVQNINKLPPVHFDHIDVTRLLKELLVLQRDVVYIKQNYALSEELTALKSDVENIKSASIVNNFEMTNVNAIRRSRSNLTAETYDSGPIGLLHIPESQIKILTQCKPPDGLCSGINESSSPVDKQQDRIMSQSLERMPSPRIGTGGDVSSTEVKLAEPGQAPSAVPSDFPNSKTIISNSTSQKSFSQVASVEGKWREKDRSEDWKLVQRKRYRNRLETAKGEATPKPEIKFRAADSKIPLFINNVDRCTSVDDIINYIQCKTDTIVCMEKIKFKQERGYDAYKILVPRREVTSTRSSLYLSKALVLAQNTQVAAKNDPKA